MYKNAELFAFKKPSQTIWKPLFVRELASVEMQLRIYKDLISYDITLPELNKPSLSEK